MAEDKVPIDYLQFLNQPEQSDDEAVWFFTYLDPKSEEIIRFQHKIRNVVFNKYKSIQKKLLKLQKEKIVVIETTTVIDQSKLLDSKINTKKSGKNNNKLTIREINSKALEFKIQGYSKDEIVAALISTYSIKKILAEKACTFAYDELAKSTDDDYIRLVVHSHSELYDILYKRLIELYAPKLAMRALKVKEALNGIGQDIFEIQVNNVFEQENDLISYGMAKLNANEQKEFVRILNRIQRVNNEKQKQLTASKASSDR